MKHNKIPSKISTTYSDRGTIIISKYFIPEIQLVVDFDEKISESDLERSAHLLLDAEPILGCRFIERKHSPYFERINTHNIQTECFFRVITCKESEREQKLDSVLLEKIDPTVGPLVKVFLLRGENSDRIVVKLSHFAGDTGATKGVGYKLAEIYSNIIQNPDFCPRSNPGSRNFIQIFRSFPAIQLLKYAWEESEHHRVDLSDHAEVLRIKTPNSNGGRYQFVIRHITSENYDTLISFCRKNNTTINDIFVAAYLRALAQHNDWKGDEHIRLSTTVDLRRYIPKSHPVGTANLSAFCTVDLAKNLGNDFLATLDRVKTQMDAYKQHGLGLHMHSHMRLLTLPFPYFLTQKGMTKILDLGFKKGKVPNTLTNLGPIVMERLDFGEIKPKSAFTVVPASIPPAFAVGLSGDGHQLSLTTGFCDESLERTRVERFFDSVVDQLPIS